MNIVPLGSGEGMVSAAITGDETAFDALVGPLIEPGFKLAAVMLRDSEEARDAVQEACVTAWRRLAQLRDETHIRSWFLSIVANQCRTRRRAKWWSVVRLPAIHSAEESSHPDWESRLDLDRQLRTLSERQRLALRMWLIVSNI